MFPSPPSSSPDASSVVRVFRPEGEPIAALANPAVLFGRFWGHRGLIRQFGWRAVQNRYRGSVLGLLWSFVTPLLMLAIYTFVFSQVFQARWGTTGGAGVYDFAMVLFAALVPFQFVSECWSAAPTLVTHNANYVKRVVFPVEVLPVAHVLAALLHAAIGVGILLIGQLAIHQHLSWQILWAPLCWLPLLALAVGGALALAALGVFVRDVGNLVTIALSVLFFLTPIFYPLDAVPERFRSVLHWNPLTPMVENLRRTLVVVEPYARSPDWGQLLVSVAIGGSALWLGALGFLKARKAFADVI